MFWIGFLVVFVIVAVALYLWGNSLGASDDPELRSLGGWMRLGALGVVLVLGGGCTFTQSIHAVPAGHVGVLYQFGAIAGQTSDGLVMVAPWMDLRQASVQTQRRQFEKLTAFSKETQDIYLKVTLNYSVSPEAIQNLYRTVGPNWFDVLIPPRVENYAKEATVKYETVDVAPHREDIRREVRERLTAELKPFSVTVSDLLIENIDFDKVFKDAIDAKQVASQEALKEFENVAKERNKADQKVEQARGEGQSLAEKAKGEAQAITVRAAAQAAANTLLSQSITDRLIAYETVKEWDGKLPLVSGQGASGLIDLRTAVAAATPTR